MSSTKRLLKREAKLRKTLPTSPKRKRSKGLQFEDEIEFEHSEEMDDQSLEQSSRMMSLGNKGPELEDDGNSTIYHVPSFLLKTYEIVDVSEKNFNVHFYRTKSTIQ